jgi:hypothetical protein
MSKCAPQITKREAALLARYNFVEESGGQIIRKLIPSVNIFFPTSRAASPLKIARFNFRCARIPLWA